jgi:hypothetical protein
MDIEKLKPYLDAYYEWVINTAKVLDNRGKNYKGRPSVYEPPEAGAYPVVLASRPREKRCEGISDCDNDKTYSRTPEGWREYCQECRKHRVTPMLTISTIHNIRKSEE